jgi:hypothetical protein
MPETARGTLRAKREHVVLRERPEDIMGGKARRGLGRQLGGHGWVEKRTNGIEVEGDDL